MLDEQTFPFLNRKRNKLNRRRTLAYFTLNSCQLFGSQNISTFPKLWTLRPSSSSSSSSRRNASLWDEHVREETAKWSRHLKTGKRGFCSRESELQRTNVERGGASRRSRRCNRRGDFRKVFPRLSPAAGWKTSGKSSAMHQIPANAGSLTSYVGEKGQSGHFEKKIWLTLWH